MIYFLAGLLFGFLIGLIPGFHVNNVLPFFILIPDPFSFAIAASIAFVFSSAVPSILLGAPNADTALLVLPGHRMLLTGNGYTAIILSVMGSLFTVFLSLPFLFLLILFLPTIYVPLQFLVPFVLAALVFFVLLNDRPAAILIAAMSAALGLLTFNHDALLPLLTGFFGLSTLLLSLRSKRLPAQKIRFESKLSRFHILRLSLIASFLSAFFGFLPGVSSSITGLAAKVFGKMKTDEFLTVVASTNTAYMIFSFFALSLISKTRSGSAIFLAHFQLPSVFYMIGIILLAGIAAAVLVFFLAPYFIRFYKKINYKDTTIAVAAFLIFINAVFAGFFGLIVLFVAASIGLLCQACRVRRINCMAALIIPTILVLL